MSTHTIMDFKAQFLKGFARPNLFKVQISKVKTSEQPKYEMSCYQAQIPGHNIATTDKDIGFRSIAYQKIFSDVILGFYVDSNLSQLKYFQEWIEQIIDTGPGDGPNPNRHNYYDNYIGTVKITQENRSGQKVATWTLHDAYPKQVDPIQLDYGTNDAVMTCNATITYRHFTVVWYDLVKIGDGLLQPDTYAPSSNTELNRINPMTEIRKEGWKFRDHIPGFNKADYPTWDTTMSFAEQAKILDGYRASNASQQHGRSKSGGAAHMVAEVERTEF